MIEQFKICTNPKCLKLGVEQSVEEFYKCTTNKDGLQYSCKTCQLANSKTPKFKATQAIYRKTPKSKAAQVVYTKTPKAKATKKRYNKSPKARAIKAAWRNSPEGKTYMTAWRNSPEGKIAISIRTKVRLATDIPFKLAHHLRTRLNKALNGNLKSSSAVRDLGCTIEWLKGWLEMNWEPWMNWDNYGRKNKSNSKIFWTIDHDIPLDTIKNPDGSINQEQLLKVCHWTNLFPMENIKNIKKSNKIL